MTLANFPVKSLLKLLLKFSVDWDFPDGPVVKTLPLQGAWVQFLALELRSHKPHGMAKKRKKKKFCVEYIFFPHPRWIQSEKVNTLTFEHSLGPVAIHP